MTSQLFAEFTVIGTPGPQGSKRAFRTKGGRIAMVESSAKVAPWRQAVGWSAKQAMRGRPVIPPGEPIQICVQFRLKRPKAHFARNGQLRDSRPTYVATKPDLSKLLRSTEDAMTGIVWHDDSQVVTATISKVYTDSEPGALISIWSRAQ